MFFDFARKEGFPTQYPPNHTPVTVDVLDAGFILAAVILAVCFYISIISTRTDQNICLYIRVTISILIGVMIMLGNFGQEWEVGEIKTNTHYKAGSGAEIYAKVGIKIGLRSVNVTLKSIGNQTHGLENERIDYNERFHWTWDQGRFGFGPSAGLLQREFREAQYRGAPLPILWVVDYFVIDGEGFRYGRFYRTAGWYSHIAMWSAFPCWLLANILFRSVVRYGGYLLGIAGCLQLIANLLWLVIRNPNPLVIPFKNDTILTHFGPTYWLTFSSGIICLAIFIAITVCEFYFHVQLHIFFGLDPITNSDEKYLSAEEQQVIEDNQHPNDAENVPMRPMNRERDSVDRKRSLFIRVRRNTNSVIRRSRAFDPQHTDPIYGNTGEAAGPSKDVILEEDEVEYDNITLIPPANRNLPPLPRRNR